MDRQYVGIDFHRRRSVVVGLSATGEKLSSVRIPNDPVVIAAAVAEAGPPLTRGDEHLGGRGVCGNLLEMPALDQRVDRVLALAPPWHERGTYAAHGPGRGSIGESLTVAAKASSGCFHALVVRIVGLTSRPRRCSARRAAS
jgi:hypothetical protein